MLSKTRMLGVAGFVAVLVSGCGSRTSPDSTSVDRPQTVTFYVKDMGDRLNLL